jgi:hypothetical protein
MPEPREIPPGKILLAEYGTFDDDERAVRTIHEKRTHDGTEYTLWSSSPGFETAGSVARWTNGYHACTWYDRSGARQGRHTKTLDEARQLLDRWTTAAA